MSHKNGKYKDQKNKKLMLNQKDINEIAQVFKLFLNFKNELARSEKNEDKKRNTSL